MARVPGSVYLIGSSAFSAFIVYLPCLLGSPLSFLHFSFYSPFLREFQLLFASVFPTYPSFFCQTVYRYMPLSFSFSSLGSFAIACCFTAFLAVRLTGSNSSYPISTLPEHLHSSYFTKSRQNHLKTLETKGNSFLPSLSLITC